MADEETIHQREGDIDAGVTETIRATLRDIQSRAPAEEEVEEAPAVVDGAESKVEAQPEVPAKPDKPRDEEGKFAKAPKVKAPAAKETPKSAAPTKADTPSAQAAPASEQAAAAPTEGADTAAPQIDINRAPSSWKPAAKAAWAALPEPVRAEIYRREGDYHVGLKGIKQNADFGQAVRGVVEPYRMLIEAEGGTPERAIADTMKTAALFRIGTQQQKLDALLTIDKQYNAGLLPYLKQAIEGEVARRTGQPAAPAQQVQQQPMQDPRVDTLMASMEAEKRQRAAVEEKTVNDSIGRFMAAKDDKGQPAYPFIDNVLEDMSARIGIMRRTNPGMPHDEVLKLSYDAAVWANPETRAVLLSEQQAAASRPSESLQKVEQAKRAQAGNMPKRGALPAMAATPALRLGSQESDDSIRDTYRQLTANN